MKYYIDRESAFNLVQELSDTKVTDFDSLEITSFNQNANSVLVNTSYDLGSIIDYLNLYGVSPYDVLLESGEDGTPCLLIPFRK